MSQGTVCFPTHSFSKVEQRPPVSHISVIQSNMAEHPKANNCKEMELSHSRGNFHIRALGRTLAEFES